MRRVLLALAAVLLFAGCGSKVSSPARTNPTTTTTPSRLTFPEPNGKTCYTRSPPAGGECVAQQEAAAGHRLSLIAPLATPEHQQCADWSQYQGGEPNTTGLHCIIIQAAYGLNVEPSVRSQLHDAQDHGLRYGVYDFGEPGIYAGDELQFIHSLVPGAPLGYWFDAEVSGVFWRSCEFTASAQELGLRIFGVFSYPGGYAAGGGTHCAGYLWASEWSVAGPSPFGGYPASAIKLWQSCGTCDRFGVTTDLDVDEGLIALGSPPKPKPPTHAALRRELQADLSLRKALRALEAKHDCRNPPERHTRPSTAAYRHACYGVWVPQGRRVDAAIKTLEKELR